MKGYLRLLAIAGASFFACTTNAISHEQPPALILVVDGAGDLKGCSTALQNAAALYHIPLHLDTFPWSHGHYRLYRDQVDIKHFRAKGRELAEQITTLKAMQPDRPIVLVSHSAGCSVALAASAWLPEDALERQVLLAPSVSTRYDLRRALRASKLGIDVFASRKDRWALGLVIRCIGSADERRDEKAAGRYGFEAVGTDPEDAALNRRLRQHFWSEADTRLGHDGRHHGMHAPAFLKERVLPLLQMSQSEK